MPIVLSPAATKPDEVPPIIAVKLGTAVVLQRAQLMWANGQLRPCLPIDCATLAQLRKLGAGSLVLRLLLPRRIGAAVAWCGVSPGLRGWLPLLRRESSVALVR